MKINNTDVVTVCLFRIFTFENIILNPVTVQNICFMCCDVCKKTRLVASNNCSGHYTENVAGHYFSIVAR